MCKLCRVDFAEAECVMEKLRLGKLRCLTLVTVVLIASEQLTVTLSLPFHCISAILPAWL